MTDDRQPHPVDVHVGAKVCLYRSLIGMSQKALGYRIGVSAQQVARYEDASIRISASRLLSIAHALNVDVSLFFKGYHGSYPRKTAGDPSVAVQSVTVQTARRLIESYDDIPDKNIRKDMVRLMESIGKAFHWQETSQTAS